MESKEYFYLNGDSKVGPLSLDALKFTPITPATLVWNNTLPDWVEARTLPELTGLFASANVPPPSPPAPNYNAGNAYNNPDKPPMPENYLVFAILATVLCCLPLGIVSLINATKVSSAYAAGDYEGAQKASADAKKWAIWSAIIGPILLIVFVFFYVAIIRAALGLGVLDF
jgi:uncharacterized integral membrane protein